MYSGHRGMPARCFLVTAYAWWA